MAIRWKARGWFANVKQYEIFKKAVSTIYSEYLKSNEYKETPKRYRISHKAIQDDAVDIMAEAYNVYGNFVTFKGLTKELRESLYSEIEDRTFASHPLRVYRR